MVIRTPYKHMESFLTFYFEYVPRVNAAGRGRERLFGKRPASRPATSRTAPSRQIAH